MKRESPILAAVALVVTLLSAGCIGSSVAIAEPDSDCPSATFRIAFKTNAKSPPDLAETRVGSLSVPLVQIYGKTKHISRYLDDTSVSLSASTGVN